MIKNVSNLRVCDTRCVMVTKWHIKGIRELRDKIVIISNYVYICIGIVHLILPIF